MANLLHNSLNNIQFTFRRGVQARDVATAMHEAAHAVCALALGFRVSELYADFRNPDPGGYEGATRWDDTGASAAEIAIVCTAGWQSLQLLESGVRFTCGHPVAWPSGGDLSDLQAALGDEARDFIPKAGETARKILQEHRAVVDALASALLIKPRLSEAEIRAIAGSALADRWQKRTAARVSTPAPRSSAPAVARDYRPATRGTQKTMRDVVPGLRYSDPAPVKAS